MTDVISFPGLGWELTLNRVAFSIGDFYVYWYGILFAVAFLLGILYFHYRAKEFGIHPYDGLDVLLWAIVGGLVGARAYYVIFQWDMYKDDLMKIFAFREGGIAIYGGIIGAILVGYIACRVKKLPLLPMLDVGLPALLLGQAIGRWGNFINMEAFGTNTTLPWGMTSTTIQNYLTNMQASLAEMGIMVDPALPVHPTFFYESLWDFIGFLVLAFVITRCRRYDGQVALWYMGWYGFGRALVEGLRTDSLMWGAFRVSQVLGAVLFVLAAVLLIMFQFKLKGGARPSYLKLYAQTEESKVRIVQTEENIAKEKQKKRVKKGSEVNPEKTAETAKDALDEEPGAAGTEGFEEMKEEVEAEAQAEAEAEEAVAAEETQEEAGEEKA